MQRQFLSTFHQQKKAQRILEQQFLRKNSLNFIAEHDIV